MSGHTMAASCDGNVAKMPTAAGLEKEGPSDTNSTSSGSGGAGVVLGNEIVVSTKKKLILYAHSGVEFVAFQVRLSALRWLL